MGRRAKIQIVFEKTFAIGLAGGLVGGSADICINYLDILIKFNPRLHNLLWWVLVRFAFLIAINVGSGGSSGRP